MPTLLKVKELKTVGLVDEGANPESDIVFFKIDELEKGVNVAEKKPNALWRLIAKGLGIPQEEVDAAVAADADVITKSTGEVTDMTFDPKTLDEAGQEAWAAMDKRATDAEAEVETLKVVPASTEPDPVVKAELPVEVRKAFEDMEKRAEAAETAAKEAGELAKRLEREGAVAEFVKRAEALPAVVGKTDDAGELLYKIDQALDEEDSKSLFTMLKSANELALTGAFAEFGGQGTNQGETVMDEINVKVEKAMEADSKLTKEQAMVDVLDGDKPLYDRYVAEQRSN